MRVVSWNMARNTTSKSVEAHERAWRYLASLNPDVALVQEATPPSWVGDIWDVVIADVRRWGSAVLAKRHLGLTAVSAPTAGIWERDGYIATASIMLPDGVALLLGSVHAPLTKTLSPEFLAGYDPEGIRLSDYPVAYYYDVPYAIYRDLVGDRFLVSGDWNVSPVLWDRHHTNSHEGEFFVRAAKHGWFDCYRQFHEDEGRTWFRGNDRPYQLDHAFCDAETATRLTACDIDQHPAATMKLSDHAPLVIELSLS